MSDAGRQKRYFWMIGIALIACAIVLCLFVGLLHRRFHPENCTAIRPGMTLNEVEDLLGGPPGDYGWLWFGSSAMTLEGVVAPPGSTEMVWLNDDKRIEVYFDKQGRVAVFINGDGIGGYGLSLVSVGKSPFFKIATGP